MKHKMKHSTVSNNNYRSMFTTTNNDYIGVKKLTLHD